MDSTDSTSSHETPPMPPVPQTPAPVMQPSLTPPPPPAPGLPAPTRTGVPAGLVAVAIVISLLVGGAAGLAGGYLAYSTLPAVSDGDRRVEIIGDTTEEVVAVAAAVALPSVVNIDVSGQGPSSDLPSGHPGVPLQGEGSGVAYRPVDDGGTYIITNAHVVDGADRIVVTDSTGERYTAELVGADSESDIAVIRVAASIPTITIGDSDGLVVGQMAIAIGSPFGLEHSVSAGVISATHRSLTGLSVDGRYPLVDSIQTDAAINPGNSGGALVDRAGMLIGIPTAIYSETGTSDGVGLAIPVKTATRAADALIDTGRVDTPFLGILGQTVTEDLAEAEDLPVDFGALVVEVTPDTEAEKAGVRAGDVVVGLDDTRIRTMDELILVVRRQAVGDEVTLTIWRDGEETTLDMTIGIKPQDLTVE